MDADLQTKLTRILALASHEGGNENEKLLAMTKLNELLAQHNLSIADLETRGHKAAPGVKEKPFDLAKAAFKWKLNLAEVIASHYYCYPMVDHYAKTVRFIGRPDNVESLSALYNWIIEQIRVLSRETRREHIRTTGEHIDPLRYQLAFGLGIVGRIKVRLEEIRENRANDNKMHALVVHHESEISDYLEEQYGYRRDGQKTKAQLEREADWKRRAEEEAQLKAECEANGNMEPYYQKYPWERPKTEEELAAQVKEAAKLARKYEKQRQRRVYREPKYREMSDAEWTRIQQSATANQHGAQSAHKVNLEPFLNEGERKRESAKQALPD